VELAVAVLRVLAQEIILAILVLLILVEEAAEPSITQGLQLQVEQAVQV
jgi:hypothetical protein